MDSQPTVAQFPSAPMIILVVDLTGYTRGFHTHSDSEMAGFLDRFYRMVEHVIQEQGGKVIKFMGDAALTAFPPDAASEAVRAAVAMRHASDALADDVGLDFRLGANIHFGETVASEFGSGESRRYDIIGRAVNQTFLIGRGGGIRLSERVYRKLASEERSPWEKHKPPTVYVLDDSNEPYAVFGKSPSENAIRW